MKSILSGNQLIRRNIKLNAYNSISNLSPSIATSTSSSWSSFPSQVSSSSSTFIRNNSSTSSNPDPNSNSNSNQTSNSSIHASEINHFSKLSSQWWDPHGEFGLLHSMNPIRVKFIKDKILECSNWEKAHRQVTDHKQNNTENRKKRNRVFDQDEDQEEVRFLKGLKVLDLGCGGGLLTESLARLGASTIGLDASSSNINIANLHSSKDPFLNSILKANSNSNLRNIDSENSLSYRCSTAEDLLKEQEEIQSGKGNANGNGNENGTFDVVCAMEVLEHVNGPDQFLRDISGLLKPGGHLFLSTISRTFLSKLLTINLAEDLLKLVEPGTHTFSQYIKPSELLGFFQNDLNWYSSNSSSNSFSNTTSPSSSPFPSIPIKNLERDLIPKELKFEIRGCGFNPIRNEWDLFSRSKSENGEDLSTLCNYFFWIRKPLDA